MKTESWKTTTHVVKNGKAVVSKKTVDWTAERSYRANSSTVSVRVSYRHVVNMLKKK